MTILHIANISNSPFSGVSVVVPEHVKAQGKFANTALLNILNIKIEALTVSKVSQLPYMPSVRIVDIPEPFNKPDLVVFHEVYRKLYLPISRQLRNMGIPYVIIPHGELSEMAQKKKWLKKKMANMLLFSSFYNKAAAIQCLSNTEMESTRIVKCKKILGTNGVDLPSRIKESFRDDDLQITYIGRLEIIHKGLDLLIKAIKNIVDNLENVHKKFNIDIYGPDVKGRFAAVKKLIDDNKLVDRVSLHLAVTGEEKIEKLLDADVFIQTSRYEGMPMGILEAMGYGIPCLVTEGTCLGRITRQYDAGWVAENNIESIADTMIKAINDTDAYRLKSFNARRLIEENFTWDVIAKDALKEYNDLIK